MSAGPIRSVAVAGDGIVAWSAAAALRRRLPWLEVALVRAPVPANALADRVASTLPSILAFHGDLGLKDDDAVLRAGSIRRLGTTFAGWNDGLAPYFHGYGAHGRPFGAASFQQHWTRAAHAGRSHPYDAHAAGAALAQAGRFAEPGDGALDRFEHGLIIDPPRYRAMMRAFALHLGVREGGDLAGVEQREEGGVAALALAGGGRVAADLFVDATGPDARIRAGLGGEREDWSSFFVCDRVVIEDTAPDPTLPPSDRVEATAAGWRWAASTTGRGQAGRCLSSAHEAADGAPLRPGAWGRPWQANCVAIGDAAVAIESLEWTNLHLAHSAIDRIVAMFPDRGCAPVELAEYNRQCGAEAMRARDFVLLHYAASARPEPFWREAAAVPHPPSLAHTLTQFRERGRLPFYEEETFDRDSWAAVLFGQGVLPRRIDPLIEDSDPALSDRAMTAFRAELAQAVAAAPAHRDYHDSAMRRIAR